MGCQCLPQRSRVASPPAAMQRVSENAEVDSTRARVTVTVTVSAYIHESIVCVGPALAAEGVGSLDAIAMHRESHAAARC